VTVALVDYGMGNRRSVEKALEHVGARVVRTAERDAVTAADALVLPGVGAFPEAMRRLAALDLVEPIRERAAAGVPVLGICLGMQLLFDSSEEHEGAAGLGLLPGTVTRLRAPGLKVPHIGWNAVRFERPSALTAGLGDGAAFYHVHTYACRPREEGDVVGRGEYGERFVSIVERENVMGAQFHPEKSSLDGLALLRNFAGVAVAAVSTAKPRTVITTSVCERSER
jgi:imidazole glycerol-phosphate synthase subunit HisH